MAEKKMGAPVKYNIPDMIVKCEDYTNKTQIPILKEICYLNHWNYKYIYELCAKHTDLSESIKRLLDKKEAQLERLALTGEINPTFAIFSQKQMGWSDKKTIELEGNEDKPLRMVTISDIMEIEE